MSYDRAIALLGELVAAGFDVHLAVDKLGAHVSIPAPQEGLELSRLRSLGELAGRFNCEGFVAPSGEVRFRPL